MEMQQISTGAPWEDKVGYSRAMRMGNVIEISGTVAVREGVVIGTDEYTQTKEILSIIEETLVKCGATLQNVIRTRMYVMDVSKWEEVGRAHREFFKDIKPATSMIEVSRLISREYLVEIEATAWVG